MTDQTTLVKMSEIARRGARAYGRTLGSGAAEEIGQDVTLALVEGEVPPTAQDVMKAVHRQARRVRQRSDATRVVYVGTLTDVDELLTPASIDNIGADRTSEESWHRPGVPEVSDATPSEIVREAAERVGIRIPRRNPGNLVKAVQERIRQAVSDILHEHAAERGVLKNRARWGMIDTINEIDGSRISLPEYTSCPECRKRRNDPRERYKSGWGKPVVLARKADCEEIVPVSMEDVHGSEMPNLPGFPLYFRWHDGPDPSGRQYRGTYIGRQPMRPDTLVEDGRCPNGCLPRLEPRRVNVHPDPEADHAALTAFGLGAVREPGRKNKNRVGATGPTIMVGWRPSWREAGRTARF